MSKGVASGYFANQIVYWAGPLAGAALAGLAYAALIGRSSE